MPYLKFFVLVNLVSLVAGVHAQDATPPPFKPTSGMEMPSASIGAKPPVDALAVQPQTPPPPPPPPMAGRVFAISGEWTNAAGQPLRIASAVNAGEKISAKAGGKSSISIVLLSGSPMQRTCPDAPDCGNLVIPSPKAPMSDNFERILIGLQKAPENLAITALGGETAPVPQVLMTDGKMIHFGPVVNDLPNGYYDLQWIALKDGVPDPDPARKYQFPWSPKDAPADTVKPMANGMYRFSILRNNATMGMPADVLVLGRREYTRLRPYFEEARQVSNSWNIPDKDIRTFQVLALWGINGNRRE